MKIAGLHISHPTVLAPLAGITHLPFRRLLKAAGCGLVCSEMISANGLLHESAKTIRLMDSHPEEKPLSVQIFGSDPAIMAEAASMVEDAGADILDINMGCSVKKILKTGAGSALMKSPGLVKAILAAVRDAIRIPLTIKIRSGWDATGHQALAISRIAQDCGVDAVAVHPRTATQGFSGQADWRLIAAVKQQLRIPVIGNGDIATPDDALRMLENTGCDLIMIGRAAVGNPLLFSRINARLAGRPEPPFDVRQHFAMMESYLEACIDYMGEAHACRIMRSRLGWFVKGLPNSSRFRESITRISSREEALERIRSYAATLKLE